MILSLLSPGEPFHLPYKALDKTKMRELSLKNASQNHWPKLSREALVVLQACISGVKMLSGANSRYRLIFYLPPQNGSSARGDKELTTIACEEFALIHP